MNEASVLRLKKLWSPRIILVPTGIREVSAAPENRNGVPQFAFHAGRNVEHKYRHFLSEFFFIKMKWFLLLFPFNPITEPEPWSMYIVYSVFVFQSQWSNTPYYTLITHWEKCWATIQQLPWRENIFKVYIVVVVFFQSDPTASFLLLLYQSDAIRLISIIFAFQQTGASHTDEVTLFLLFWWDLSLKCFTAFSSHRSSSWSLKSSLRSGSDPWTRSLRPTPFSHYRKAARPLACSPRGSWLAVTHLLSPVSEQPTDRSVHRGPFIHLWKDL